MCFKFSLILPVLALFFVQMTSCTAQNNRTENDKAPIQSLSNDIQTGAQQTDEYFPLLKNQRVGLLVNQTSVVPDGQGQWISLVDTLRHAGMDVRFILTPEHGYEGKISAGSTVGFCERLVGDHHVATAGQAAFAEGAPGAQSHDDGMTHRNALEILEIGTDVPRNQAAIADGVVFGGRADQADVVFHTATGALIAGHGS